ncbi:SAM-dependent methyltransferase [Niveibacterium microcysteis]|uniref:SAM-dependent methyltransferase n=1 Tax=Niveibacterium microcysteis TaxID=2811415 RepID=A0ABX7M1Z2_9RHOO|nr:SAM-dependent methyltransferase [Niveibacterium microcysteis]QSI75777.1 SAM-dependent methyltransferase [Niveibacterium microcysteis]
MPGTLFLLPVALGPADSDALHPPATLRTTHLLRHFVVENAKSARAELKRIGHPQPLQALDVRELPKTPTDADLSALLAPALAGQDIGLMSEAGCPAVADPGALLVRQAHRLGIRVAPLVGPSSLLLSLMASGLNGQSFAFHGYLPVKEAERAAALRELEKESRRFKRTQLFIETPYRNQAMFAALLAGLSAETQLCVARELTTAGEWIATRSIASWKKSEAPDLDRRPTVFLFLA